MRGGVFENIQLLKPKRAKFDLSHERKMSVPFGALIPTFVSEVLPGDSFQYNANIHGRFQAMLAPPMHRVNVFTHCFFVPYRILNRNFTRFINYQGNRPNLASQVAESPYFLLKDARGAITNGIPGAALKDGSLLDYLGFPTAPNETTISNVGGGTNEYDDLRISAFMPLAYQRIWSDWYRDQNFTRPMFSEDGDGQTLQSTGGNYFETNTAFGTGPAEDFEATAGISTDVVQLLTLRWRAWEKDYLTSSLPYANQGIADPRVPITVPAGALGNTPVAGQPVPAADATFGKTGGIQYPPTAGNPTDLGSFTMSALRVASALKRWLENSARGGTRYIESLWNHWHVKSSDARLSRAEYLGGGVQPMVISEVVTTAEGGTGAQPPGYLAGHGVSFGTTNRFTRRFEEHGCVMAITSIIPRTSYLYSLPRYFMRSEPLDFAWPELSQIGEQGVLGSEVFFKLNTDASTSAPNYTAGLPVNNTTYQGIVTRYPMGYVGASYFGFDLQNDRQETSVTSGSVWGFQQRYGEYKYSPDTVHGLFRNSQSFWHFGRMLSPGVQLNNAFVTSDPRNDVFAVLPTGDAGEPQYSQHPINLHIYNRVSVIRALPYYNTPQLW